MTATEPTTTVNLHDAALEAYHAWDRAREENEKAQRFNAETDLCTMLGRLMLDRLNFGGIARDNVVYQWGEPYVPDGVEGMALVTVDRLMFAAFFDPAERPNYKEQLRLVGNCGKCLKPVISEKNIETLADLGALLHDWEPHCGNCDSETTDPDECVQLHVHGNLTEQQLIGAVRDLIREETRYV